MLPTTDILTTCCTFTIKKHIPAILFSRSKIIFREEIYELNYLMYTNIR